MSGVFNDISYVIEQNVEISGPGIFGLDWPPS